MAAARIQVVLLFLWAVVAAGCGGIKSATVADLQGEWKNTEGEHPFLSLGANGKGVLEITFSEGGGRGGLLMSQVEVKQEEGKFFLETFVSSQKHRFELNLVDRQTMKLKLIEPSDNREFTLRKK
jgi:hypothetical protein